MFSSRSCAGPRRAVLGGAAAATVLVPDVVEARRPAADDRRRGLAAAGGGGAAAVQAHPRRVAADPACGRSRRRRRSPPPGPRRSRGGCAGARRRPTARRPETLTVLSANVFTGRADTGVLAAPDRSGEPDLVVLPEAGCDFRDKLAPLVAGMGYRGWAATPPGCRTSWAWCVLAGSAGRGRAGPAGSELHYRHLQVSGGILGGRELFAVHTTAPRTTPTRRALAARPRPTSGAGRARSRPRSSPATSTRRSTTRRYGPRWAAASRRRAGVDGLVGTFPAVVAAVVRHPDRPCAGAGGDGRRCVSPCTTLAGTGPPWPSSPACACPSRERPAAAGAERRGRAPLRRGPATHDRGAVESGGARAGVADTSACD